MEMDDECVMKWGRTVLQTFEGWVTKVGRVLAGTCKTVTGISTTVINGPTLSLSTTFAAARHLRLHFPLDHILSSPRDFAELDMIGSLAEPSLKSITISTLSGPLVYEGLTYEEDETLDYFWRLADRRHVILSDMHLVGKLVYTDLDRGLAPPRRCEVYLNRHPEINMAWGNILELNDSLRVAWTVVLMNLESRVEKRTQPPPGMHS